MKFYAPMGYQPVFHNGNKPEDTLHTFVVYAWKSGICRTFIVMAKDEAGAIANFLGNIVALGAELKKTLKPEDCEPRKIMAYDQNKLAQADKCSTELAEYQEKLNDFDDRTDDLAEVHRETIVERMAELRKKISDLHIQEEVNLPSRFEQMMRRSTELVSMTLTAEKLDPQRCYGVAYFDDSRDYTSYAD